MHRLHAHIRKLVGDVVIGAADFAHAVRADDFRIGARQVKLLVDDRLGGVHQHGDARERHFGVAAVEIAHHAVAAMGVAGDDGQLRRKIGLFERRHDALVERRLGVVAPAGEVDEAGVDAVLTQQHRRVVGAVRLAKGRQHLAHGHQMLVEAEMPVGTQALQVEQAAPDALDAVAHESVGGVAVGMITENVAIDRLHVVGDAGQRVSPQRIRLRARK